MSGKPYPEGAARLSEQFRLLEDARQRIERCENEVTKAQERLDVAKHDHGLAAVKIDELMGEMDVRSPGNTGYKVRLLWLLRELNTQSERYGRNHP